MNKLVIKEIRPTKKHKCEVSSGCDKLANDCMKLKGTKKIYVCEKHLIEFYKDVVSGYFADLEQEQKELKK